MTYEIKYTQTAAEMIDDISDNKIRTQILKRIERLQSEPYKQGEPLFDDLDGSRKIKVVKMRYRIIYEVNEEARIVYIKAAGIRKEGDKSDVYYQAKKRMGLI